MSKSTRTKTLIKKIKSSATTLYVKGQLPIALFSAISKLNELDHIDYVSYLIELSNHYMRVNGYYKKYPKVHIQANKDIEQCLVAYNTKRKD